MIFYKVKINRFFRMLIIKFQLCIIEDLFGLYL